MMPCLSGHLKRQSLWEVIGRHATKLHSYRLAPKRSGGFAAAPLWELYLRIEKVCSCVAFCVSCSENFKLISLRGSLYFRDRAFPSASNRPSLTSIDKRLCRVRRGMGCFMLWMILSNVAPAGNWDITSKMGVRSFSISFFDNFFFGAIRLIVSFKPYYMARLDYCAIKKIRNSVHPP